MKQLSFLFHWQVSWNFTHTHSITELFFFSLHGPTAVLQEKTPYKKMILPSQLTNMHKHSPFLGETQTLIKWWSFFVCRFTSSNISSHCRNKNESKQIKDMLWESKTNNHFNPKLPHITKLTSLWWSLLVILVQQTNSNDLGVQLISKIWSKT